jgi:pimeloyl-ACP methyl ester carboxylesterase
MSAGDGGSDDAWSYERDALGAALHAAASAGSTEKDADGRPGWARRAARALLRTLLRSIAAGLLLIVGVSVGIASTDRVVLALADARAPEPAAPAPGVSPVTVTIDTVAPDPVVGGPRFEDRACPDGVDRFDVRCGFLDVPESRTDPDGRRVRIAVSIRQVSSDAPDAQVPRRAVVVLSGGPGQPLLEDAAAYQYGEALGNSGTDVIVLDQRGTGRSVPSLACAGTGIMEDYPSDPQVVEDCAVRHLLQGIALDAYTTLESAADIEDLRRALGYDQFDLVGLSYGTRLALVTAQQHPEGIRSLVLAGVDPPGAPRVYPPLELARVVSDLDAVCGEQPGCREAYGDLEALLIAAMDRAASDGAHAQVVALTTALFFEAYWIEGTVRLPKVLATAAEGDWQAVGELLPSYATAAAVESAAFARSSASSADLEAMSSFGLSLSVNCSESSKDPVVDPAYAPILARLEAAGVSRTYREILALPTGGWATGVFCGIWGVVPQSDVAHDAVTSDVPTLLLSGRFDPTTPPRHADLAAETLSRSHVVVADHLAHGLILVDRCIDRIVAEFLEQPERRPATDCLVDARQTRIELR